MSSYFARRITPRKPSVITAPILNVRKDIRLNFFQPELFQKIAITHMDDVDPDAFIIMAREYRWIKGRSDLALNADYDWTHVTECCLRNARVSYQVGCVEKGRCWEILALIAQYKVLLEEPRPASPIKVKQHDVLDRLSESFQTLSPSWDSIDYVKQLTEWYLHEGDIQMCIMIVLLFGYHNGPVYRPEEWFHSYITHLKRCQLFVEATEMTRDCPFELVRRTNQESTTFYSSCSRCMKPVMQGKHSAYWICERCEKPTGSCSVCHLPVRSVYVNCRGCGHGGHIEHMREWFAESNECPTGCGHQCRLKS